MLRPVIKTIHLLLLFVQLSTNIKKDEKKIVAKSRNESIVSNDCGVLFKEDKFSVCSWIDKYR